MSDHQFDLSSRVLQPPTVDRCAQTAPTTTQRESADSTATTIAHAAAIDRATWGRSDRVARSFLHLQKQHGNRYVERVVARAKEDAGPNAVHPSIERQIHEQRGAGQPLDAGVKRQMEGSIGADFSNVRIHTSAHSDRLNHALSARAFTTGNDIFFREGAYQPGSFVGRELIAHELTHVVQQNGSQLNRSQISRAMTVSQPGDPHEMEAEHTAHAVMQRELHPGHASTPAVSRQEEDPHAMASRCKDDAQRQPEATHEDEEKKKHHASRQIEGSGLDRSGEEQAE